jgi:hypothetical protein
MNSKAQLTKRQHIIPAKSISRFCGSEGHVFVTRQGERPFRAKPTNSIFCAKRVWEERSERNHKEIEDRYQAIADAICADDLKVLGTAESEQVSAMFALWMVRSRLADAPLTDVDLPALSLAAPAGCNVSGWEPDERDQLEEAGLVVSSSDGIIPGRMQAWPLMQRGIAALREKLRGVAWGVWRADEGEFLMPDRYEQSCLLPVSPTVLLVLGKRERTLSGSAVAKINRLSISEHGQWFFKRVTGCGD